MLSRSGDPPDDLPAVRDEERPDRVLVPGEGSSLQRCVLLHHTGCAGVIRSDNCRVPGHERV